MVAWRPTPIIPALGDKGSRIKSSRSYLATEQVQDWSGCRRPHDKKEIQINNDNEMLKDC